MAPGLFLCLHAGCGIGGTNCPGCPDGISLGLFWVCLGFFFLRIPFLGLKTGGVGFELGLFWVRFLVPRQSRSYVSPCYHCTCNPPGCDKIGFVLQKKVDL